MTVDSSPNISNVFSGKVRLPLPIEVARASYAAAKPFPHVVMDGLFTPGLLDPLLPEMNSIKTEQWIVVENAAKERVRRMRSVVEMSAAGVDLVNLIHSPAFLYLLSEITGIWQLLPDPYLQGAGYADMKPGDFFNVHSDRSIAYDTGLTRRLAMIVFLNKNWKSEYNGQLELWNHEATKCEVQIEPLFNRTVIFEVAYPNYHGVPAPIVCPPDQSRQSFITYYHTVGRDGKNVKPHTSIFAPNLLRPNPITVRSIMKELAPPVLRKAARHLMDLAKYKK
jgi:hypothetical protein